MELDQDTPEHAERLAKLEKIIRCAFPGIDERPDRFGDPRATSYAKDMIVASNELPTYYEKFIDKQQFLRLSDLLAEVQEVIASISGQGESLLQQQIDLCWFTGESPLRNLKKEAERVRRGIGFCLEYVQQRRPSDPRTNWRAVSVMERCCIMWTEETGRRFPSLNNDARHSSPFGRLVGDIYEALGIGYEPGIALTNLLKWHEETLHKSKG